MKKGSLSNFLLILMLIAGLSLMLYPSFSDHWNSTRQTQIITQYAEAVANLDREEYNQALSNAEDYNRTLLTRFNPYKLTDEQALRYNDELNFSGDGIMGYVEIPSINVMLPIHHGTKEENLQVAIGHIEWTSLPTGGESTHCAISGHRGLPSARLFTDLDQLAVGDIFMIHVLNRILTYQVDQIKIVLPHESEDLKIVPGEDYLTLVTCTPYGVNTHRMLVRGTRIENLEDAPIKRVVADAVLIKPILIAPLLASPVLLILLIGLLLPKKKPKQEDDLL